MYPRWLLALKYSQYYLTASNGKGHGIHSPFIFHFITKVLNDKTRYAEYDKAETLRSRMLGNHAKVTIEDLGAGSNAGKKELRSIRSIASNSAKPAKFGQLLFRMIRDHQPRNILELGTSLGITTTYLALANDRSSVTTIEGSSAIAEIARSNFRSLGLTNVTLIEGNFDERLSKYLQGSPGADFVFIDGNHRKEPTKNYFDILARHVNQHSVLVFDDIHWSREMEEAWADIREDPRVRCTVDLFFVGIVFFREEFREKQHFIVRF